MIQALLLFCTFLCNIAIAEEEMPLDDLISNQILAEQPEAVLFCTESKLYLRPDTIYPTNSGLFIGHSHSAILIPVVFSDASGCYVPRGNFSRPESYWMCANQECSNYQRIFRNSSGQCHRCGLTGKRA